MVDVTVAVGATRITVPAHAITRDNTRTGTATTYTIADARAAARRESSRCGAIWRPAAGR